MTAFIMVAVYLGLTCIISLINKNRQSSTRNTFVAKNGMSACTLIPLLFGELMQAPVLSAMPARLLRMV